VGARRYASGVKLPSLGFDAVTCSRRYEQTDMISNMEEDDNDMGEDVPRAVTPARRHFIATKEPETQHQRHVRVGGDAAPDNRL